MMQEQRCLARKLEMEYSFTKLCRAQLGGVPRAALETEACFYNSFSVMADFVEMPPDAALQSSSQLCCFTSQHSVQDRYYGLLPYFGIAPSTAHGAALET